MKSKKISTQKGFPTPLGHSFKENGANFAIFSKHAKSVTLSLFLPKSNRPFAEIPLDSKIHKTGSIWHIFIENISNEFEYGYRIDGPHVSKKGLIFNPDQILIDPYAKSLNSSNIWGDIKNWKHLRNQAIREKAFDWENDSPPQIPLCDLLIYEMHVRGFTKHPSSQVSHSGTFLGVVEKIPYLKSLGINAIELLPIQEFNEIENLHKNPKTHKRLYNYWGYSTVNFFSPMNRYATSSEFGSAINEFKMMVRELHKQGIEVILDVVFNHTSEDGIKGPYCSFKGIDNAVYYILQQDGKHANFSGCGNTFNCNHPVVLELIVKVLRYWVVEMHVDGFRFDLASIFCRNEHGSPINDPPIVRAISEDPILSGRKLIAEPWDIGGLYQVGHFPGRWAEWNGQYRDVVRRFIKGTDNQSGPFASRISGSQDLYGYNRKPYHSINFVTSHDGFTLRDLVSYQQKHNSENGEHNRDGLSENDSWNCGEEGVTDDPIINELRMRQMKNFHLALMISLGTPMILMGDEYGHTKNGNNNTYCHDNEKNWFLWDQLQNQKDFFRFFKKMVDFRKKHPVFQATEFLKNENVDWHGIELFKPNWGIENRFVAFHLKQETRPDLYISFNANSEPIQMQIPLLQETKRWKRIVDTFLSSPDDFNDNPANSPNVADKYEMQPYSALILEAF
ncbi:MAG: glycogen debranching protein GlgX [Chlamydiae bacterium]|nr:glycogen debranching protein GlgX [Chlamydiota bacterium]